MNSRNDQLNKLFVEWKKQYSASENFVKDGVINENKYEAAKIKVLVITKEPNDPDKQAIDFREWWNEDELYFAFSNRIAEWSYGILNKFPSYDEIWSGTGSNKALDAIQHIAFMNVKKSGGLGSSVQKIINKYIERDFSFIHKQIKIIDPEIIIIGMSWERTVELLFPKINWINSGYATYIGKYENAVVIDFYHPSARNGVAASYSLLQNIIQSKPFRKLKNS